MIQQMFGGFGRVPHTRTTSMLPKRICGKEGFRAGLPALRNPFITR